MKAEHVPIVVGEPQFPEKVPRLIAEQAGVTLVKLPIMPGGVPGTDTYIEMMDYIIKDHGRGRKEMNTRMWTPPENFGAGPARRAHERIPDHPG